MPFSRPVRRMRPRALGPAPATEPHVVQTTGFVQGTHREAGEVIRLSPIAARYLVSHGVLKTKAQHDADAAAAEAGGAGAGDEDTYDDETASDGASDAEHG